MGRNGTGRDFKPGQSGNPKGRPVFSPESKEIRALSHQSVAEMGSMVLKGDIEGIQAIAKDTKATVLKVWMASIIVKAINRGDVTVLNAFLDRVVGKVKERVQITGDPDAPLSIGVFSSDQIKRMAEQVLKKE
jgi:Family of unknown function (DUF5681)